MKLGKKGFTLVEMLAAVTILGIITAMSFPVISSIKNGLVDREYDLYKQSMIHAGELYIDAYSEDVFGLMEGTGSSEACYDIYLDILMNKKLIEPITVEDATCYDNQSFVRVRKKNGVYTYDASIVCKKADREYKDKLSGSCTRYNEY